LQELWKGRLVGNLGKQHQFYAVEGSMISDDCLLQFVAIHLEKIAAGVWSARLHVIFICPCMLFMEIYYSIS
jgi:hypothetical protein